MKQYKMKNLYDFIDEEELKRLIDLIDEEDSKIFQSSSTIVWYSWNLDIFSSMLPSIPMGEIVKNKS